MGNQPVKTSIYQLYLLYTGYEHEKLELYIKLTSVYSSIAYFFTQTIHFIIILCVKTVFMNLFVRKLLGFFIDDTIEGKYFCMFSQNPDTH